MSLPQTYKALVTQSDGSEPRLEELRLEMPGPNKVLVKMDYAPINPADFMVIEGFYPDSVKLPHAVGMEGSGTVAALGEGTKNLFQVGDKVHVTGTGSWAEYMTVDKDECFKVKEWLSQEQAASHLVNPVTAVFFANLVEEKSKNKIAVHTLGASSIGRMMIRYFKKRGIRLICIVRRDECKEELRREGAAYVLNCKDVNFERQLKEVCEKEDAKICFDSVCGDMTERVLRNMPEGSTMYIYGRLASRKVGEIDAANFMWQNKSVKGLWTMRYLKELNKEDRMKVIKEAHSLLDRELCTEVQKTFRIDDYKQALELTGEHNARGKVLLRLS